jgi:dethiobiotin synthetase
MLRIGVTGTDTGVGKTVVSRALVLAARHAGQRVAGMKPVETGVTGHDPHARVGATDAVHLWRASGEQHTLDDVGPTTYAEPLAPAVAAVRAGRPLAWPMLDAARARLEAESDMLVVEGAGGLLVPFDNECTFADLCARWSLDVVVVAANRLGALNHTALTLSAARAHGLTVRGVILSETASEPRSDAERTNHWALDTLMPSVVRDVFTGVPIVALPWLGCDPADDVVRRAAQRVGMLATLWPNTFGQTLSMDRSSSS